MKTFSIFDNEGQLTAFEIPNSFMSRQRVCAIISRIPKVRVLRKPKLFSFLREEVFCEFKIEDVHFLVWEPFGDSSRYHIGCVERVNGGLIKHLQEYFARCELNP